MRALRLPALNASLVECDVEDQAVGADDVRVRIEAAGICHSDAHYRRGFGQISTPRTLGHEIAGTVTEAGHGVRDLSIGDRVAIHYLRSCGRCRACLKGGEQFCEAGQMIGKHCDGGYAEAIVVPAWNAIAIPANVGADAAAVMMCSTATAYHALRLAGLREGQTLAVFGFGGLGVSAVLLGAILGAGAIAVIDVVPEKLEGARALNAHAIDARQSNSRDELLRLTEGYGVDVAIDFTGHSETMLAALTALAPRGRLVVVALSEQPMTFNPYRDLLGGERKIIGCSDHLRSELVELMELASSGRLRVESVISRRVPLQAAAINAALDDLDRGTAPLRSVIVPGVAGREPS